MTREIVAEAQKYAKDHGYEVVDKELLLAIEFERKVSFRKGAQWMQKQLESENAALKQQIKELNERVINLQSADMTHQYNQAEAERVWPQIEQQIRDDEREKTLAQFGITPSPENPEKCKH